MATTENQRCTIARESVDCMVKQTVCTWSSFYTRCFCLLTHSAKSPMATAVALHSFSTKFSGKSFSRPIASLAFIAAAPGKRRKRERLLFRGFNVWITSTLRLKSASKVMASHRTKGEMLQRNHRVDFRFKTFTTTTMY